MEARHGMAARRVSLAAARLQRQQYQQELAQLEEQQQAMKADIAQMAPLMEDESLWSLSSPSAVLEAAAAERTPTKPSRVDAAAQDESGAIATCPPYAAAIADDFEKRRRDALLLFSSSITDKEFFNDFDDDFDDSDV